jgi:diacylglycerol kinase family enzyme
MSSHIQGREIQVRLAEPESAQMDGEEIPAADAFCVSVVPKALRIKTPAEPA